MNIINVENNKCKFCGSTAAEHIKSLKSPHVACDYKLYNCPVCKCRYFDVNEHPCNLSNLYELKSHESACGTTTFKASKYWGRQAKIAVRNLGREPTNVLDIGCKYGDFLMHIPNHINRVGVELSEHASTIAKAKGLAIYSDYIENICFDKQYDIVTCFALLEHIIDPKPVLDSIKDIVVPDGLLVIMIPSYESYKRWMIDHLSSIQWQMYSPPEHLNFYSKTWLDGYLQPQFRLVNRYWTSGGQFRPLKNIPIARSVLQRLVTWGDNHSCINKIPCFDHMYSYYKKTGK